VGGGKDWGVCFFGGILWGVNRSVDKGDAFSKKLSDWNRKGRLKKGVLAREKEQGVIGAYEGEVQSFLSQYDSSHAEAGLHGILKLKLHKRKAGGRGVGQRGRALVPTIVDSKKKGGGKGRQKVGTGRLAGGCAIATEKSGARQARKQREPS